MEERTFAVILTAVQVETAAVKTVFDGFKRKLIAGDEQAYYETFIERDGEKQRIILAQCLFFGEQRQCAQAEGTCREEYMRLCQQRERR